MGKEVTSVAVNSFADFTEMHTSFLQEISNMGAGNAATSISTMITAPTDISVPAVKILSAAQAADLADMLSSRTEAYLVTLSGDIRGSLLYIIPYEFIERLVSTYFPGVSIKSRENMDDMARSMVQEMVNIASASYANNFAIMTGMMVDISVPDPDRKPSPKILAVNAPGTVNVCFINMAIEICDCKKNFNVLFFPELETIKRFMGKMGIEC